MAETVIMIECRIEVTDYSRLQSRLKDGKGIRNVTLTNCVKTEGEFLSAM